MEKKQIIKRKETKITKTQDSKTEISATEILRKTKSQITVETCVTETEISLGGTSVAKSEDTNNKHQVPSRHSLSGGDFARINSITDARYETEGLNSRIATPNALSDDLEEGYYENLMNSYGSLVASPTFEEPTGDPDVTDVNCGLSPNEDETHFCVKIAHIEMPLEEKDIVDRYSDFDNNSLPTFNSTTLKEKAGVGHKSISDSGIALNPEKNPAGNHDSFRTSFSDENFGGILHLKSHQAIGKQKRKDTAGKSVTDLVNYFENLKKPDSNENMSVKSKQGKSPEGVVLKNEDFSNARKDFDSVASESLSAASPLNKSDSPENNTHSTDALASKTSISGNVTSPKRQKLRSIKDNMSCPKAPNDAKQVSIKEHVFIFSDDIIDDSHGGLNSLSSCYKSRLLDQKPVIENTIPEKKMSHEEVDANSRSFVEELNSSGGKPTEISPDKPRMLNCAKEEENLNKLNGCRNTKVTADIFPKKTKIEKKDWGPITNVCLGVTVFVVFVTICSKIFN